MNYRVMSDGSIAFPVRGEPPRAVAGYRRTDDPYVWVPDLHPCEHRAYPKRIKPCGKVDYPMTCLLLQQLITYKTCEECELVPD